MTNQIPYVSPSSGLIPEGYDTGLHTAVTILFNHKQDYYDRMRDIADNIGFRVNNHSDIGKVMALYFAAQDYCDGIKATVGDIFPAVQRDCNNLVLSPEMFQMVRIEYSKSKSKN